MKSGNTGKFKNILKSGNTGKSGTFRISWNTGKSGNTYEISHLVDFRSCFVRYEKFRLIAVLNFPHLFNLFAAFLRYGASSD